VVVIDPKPYVGDRTYDALQHMLNCTERLTRDPLTPYLATIGR
jgi:streptomycin 6-kinase